MARVKALSIVKGLCMKQIWVVALMLAACVKSGQARTDWVLATVDGTGGTKQRHSVLPIQGGS